jgi:hypothetical protein
MKRKITTKAGLKPKWWNISILVFIITIGIINSSCNEECDNGDIEPIDKYYVKYEVNSSTIYSGGKLDVTINTEKNENLVITISQRNLWETIIGPVQKGFNASMRVEATGETYDKLTIYTNIYVSKNGSPFALKKSDGSDTPRDNVQISYTIDY